MNVKELPKSLQRELARGTARTVAGTRQPLSGKSAAGASPRPRGTRTYRCAKCGETSKSFAAAERHADAEHHYRIECVL